MPESSSAAAPILPTRQELLDKLDRLAIAADAKLLLARLAEVTVTVAIGVA